MTAVLVVAEPVAVVTMEERGGRSTTALRAEEVVVVG